MTDKCLKVVWSHVLFTPLKCNARYVIIYFALGDFQNRTWAPKWNWALKLATDKWPSEYYLSYGVKSSWATPCGAFSVLAVKCRRDEAALRSSEMVWSNKGRERGEDPGSALAADRTHLMILLLMWFPCLSDSQWPGRKVNKLPLLHCLSLFLLPLRQSREVMQRVWGSCPLDICDLIHQHLKTHQSWI